VKQLPILKTQVFFDVGSLEITCLSS